MPTKIMSKRPKISIREPKQRYESPSTIPSVGMPHERWKSAYSTNDNPDLEPSQSSIGDSVATVSSLSTRTTNATLASKGSQGREAAHSGDKVSNKSAVPVKRSRGRTQSSLLQGRTRDVWQFLVRTVRDSHDGSNERIKLSRKEIKDGTGIGSFNTIDQALIDLQSYGLLKVYPVFGSNKGYEYELLRLDDEPESEVKAPRAIAEALKETAKAIEQSGVTHLSGDQLKELTRLAHSARRLAAEILK